MSARRQARVVRVVLARPDALADPAVRAAAQALLTDDEHARLARFRFDRDRDVALASRALERRVLGAWAGIDPAAWRFAPDGHGRPTVVAPSTVTAPVWSVANTHGLVVCAVTDTGALGVDVEPARTDAPADIVDSHFAPAERAALRALPRDAQPARFVALWTLKEAYLKARGVGLTLPLDRFAFDPSTAPPGFAIASELADDPAAWQVAQWWPLASHGVALCVSRDRDADGDSARPVIVDWDEQR